MRAPNEYHSLLSRQALASPLAVSGGPAPFPRPTGDMLVEHGYGDWRRRLTRNLSRRSDARWDPLTWYGPNTPK